MRGAGISKVWNFGAGGGLDGADFLCDGSGVNSKIQARDRFVARQIAAASPAERLERFAVLQAEAFERLRQSPTGWENFMRRNLRKRAVRVVLHD